MSTTVMSEPNPAPVDQDAARRRATSVKRAWLSALVIAIVALVVGGAVTFSWMINETHFDRPTPEFDTLVSQVEGLPGAVEVDEERWVEAPTFSDPTSWVSVTVDRAGLPGLLEAACSTDYPDVVTWSIRVRTPAEAEVSLHAARTAPNTAGDERCPDFGFDAVRLVEELDRVAPGLDIQPTIWDNGRFALVALEEEMPTGFTHLLPLIEHADDLLVAAGLDANAVVEINAANLGFVLEPGESDGYLALLTELADHSVSSYWTEGGGTPVDGIDKVQIVAPDQQHTAIEEIIRSSGLPVADLPVRFLEPSPGAVPRAVNS